MSRDHWCECEPTLPESTWVGTDGVVPRDFRASHHKSLQLCRQPRDVRRGRVVFSASSLANVSANVKSVRSSASWSSSYVRQLGSAREGLIRDNSIWRTSSPLGRGAVAGEDADGHDRKVHRSVNNSMLVSAWSRFQQCALEDINTVIFQIGALLARKLPDSYTRVNTPSL
jgi:hypothetical protein